MANRPFHRFIGIILLLAVTACAGPQPILRSNKQLHVQGRQVAQQEVEACQRNVERAGLRPGVHQSVNVASGAVLGMTVGGATGASAGMVGGLPGITIGAAVGSALGLVIGSLGGRFKPLEPEPPYAEAVESCLKEKGYEVSGWE